MLLGIIVVKSDPKIISLPLLPRLSLNIYTLIYTWISFHHTYLKKEYNPPCSYLHSFLLIEMMAQATSSLLWSK